MGMALIFLLAVTDLESGLPDLTVLMMDQDRRAFGSLLAGETPIKADLRPLLYDHGNLSRQQVLMAFDKLHDRYRILDAEVLNFQSDANYAWLEIYVRMDLEERRTGLVYRVSFAFQFKIIASRMAISRWVLQDIH